MYPVAVAALGLATLVRGVPNEINKRLDNGVGVTPAMGWNNYNAGLGATAESALAAANLFVSLGLRELGYEYVNIDDGWSSNARSNGLLVADPNKWPDGIKAVSDQIHAMNLKFGLYGDSGTATCSGFPGSQGYETVDAQTIAGWGVDLWKYDNCATPSGSSIPRYQTMRDALLATGRDIYYALCNWGADSVYTWGAETGNSWRVGGDITNSWSSAASIASNNAAIYSYAAPGGFNDFDMLEVGNGGMTTAEERAHFGIWAISKSPLILGTDLSKISAASLAIISNADVIAINQDSLGQAAGYFTPSGATNNKYYSGELSDGYVIGLVATDAAATMSASFADVPGLGAGTYSWKECYSGSTGSGTSVSANLALHDMAIFHVYKTGGPATTSKPSTTTSKATTTSKSSSTSTTSNPTTTTTPPTSGTGTPVAKYGQCGGMGWTGSTVCASGSTCTYSNDWYSQCL